MYTGEAVDSDFEFATYRDMKQRRLSLEKEEERYDAMMSCVDKMTSTLKFFKVKQLALFQLSIYSVLYNLCVCVYYVIN